MDKEGVCFLAKMSCPKLDCIPSERLSSLRLQDMLNNHLPYHEPFVHSANILVLIKCKALGPVTIVIPLVTVVMHLVSVLLLNFVFLPKASLYNNI